MRKVQMKCSHNLIFTGFQRIPVMEILYKIFNNLCNMELLNPSLIVGETSRDFSKKEKFRH